MTWSKFIENGYGSFDLRLMIEGWPHEWATHPRITHASNSNGRLVFPGLQFKGLRISQRANLRDAWPDVRGMTAQIIPSSGVDEAVSGFTRDARPVALIQANGSTPGVLAAGTTWVTRPASLPMGAYHVGSECIFVQSGGTLIRGYWNTQAQDHVMLYADQFANPSPIYAWPPTMEGRRWYLYAYGPSDSGSGDGTVIARGIVSRPPALDRDGVSWTINLDSVTRLLEQKVAGGERAEYRIRGVYHSSQCARHFTVRTQANGTNEVPVIEVAGFYETQDGFAAAFNAAIADTMAAATGNALNVASIEFSYNDGVPSFFVVMDAPGLDHPVDIGSHDVLEGITNLLSPRDPVAYGGAVNHGSFRLGAGDADGNFSVPGIKHLPPWGYPLPTSRTMLGSLRAEQYASNLNLLDSPSLYPPNRVHLQNVDGLTVGMTLCARTGDTTAFIEITDVDTTDRWIEANVIGSVWPIYLSDESSLVPVRTYAKNGNWGSFMQGVIDAAPQANLGETPHITSADVNNSGWAALWSAFPFHDYWRFRNYAFFKPTSVREVLAAELKATGWLGSLDVDGRFNVVPMPQVSPQNTASATLEDGDILIPAEGMFGSWPHWQAQADGLVNIVNLRLGYSPLTDEFDPAFDFQIRDVRSIAEHKSGGRATADIGPKSVRSTQSVKRAILAAASGRPVSATHTAPSPSELADMVAPYLRTLSEDYAVVTVCVPFTKFNITIGSIVEVSSRWIPDGLGARGVVAKKAVVVGREWSLDLASGDMGKLTLWFPRDSGRTAGYCPSGRITAQSNTGGNTWLLTFNAANALNIAWSESSDGVVTKHFSSGDAVKIVQADTSTPIMLGGTVGTVNNGARTIVVTFTAGWTPSTLQWDLMFDDNAIVARQQAYCWVADTNGQLLDGSAARQLL